MMNKKYYINPNYSLILKKDGSILVINCKNKYKNYVLNNEEISFFEKNLKKEFFECNINSKLINRFIRKKVLLEKNYQKTDFNSYSYLYSINSKINLNKLKNSKILIIGLGGIGCEIIKHFVGIGIKNYIVVDYDKVDITNLNRQYIFTRSDVGKEKTDLVYNFINNNVEYANVLKYSMKVNNSKDIESILENNNVDFIICAADTPFLDIRISVIESSLKHNLPCIFGGVGIYNGQIGPLLHNKQHKKKMLNFLYKAKAEIKNHNINKASFGPTNSLIAGYLAMDVVMYLINEKKNIKSLNNSVNINFFEDGDNNDK